MAAHCLKLAKEAWSAEHRLLLQVMAARWHRLATDFEEAGVIEVDAKPQEQQ
jgi:hypothetical protein